MSNIEEYTKNFKFMIPEFNVATWHTEIKENFKAIDALIANFVQSQQYKGTWKKVTQYHIGDLVYISDEDSDYYGYLMRVKVNHITTADDFDTFLANNPTYYEVQGEMGAQVAALRAQDWAEKTDGMVTINESPIDYSSKAYAIGGTGTETNNSKYFKEQAELARDGILLDPGFIAIKADFLGDQNIKTVADNIQNVNSIGNNILNILSVYNNLSSINTCSSNINAILDAPTQATNAQNSANSAAQSAALAYQYGNDKINQTHISNCITEIPQDIKLELNNGTLTLKAGSKVYVPNGAGVFNTVTIANDLSVTRNTNTQETYVYRTTDNSFSMWQHCYSGTTAPSGETYMLWYDTTNNKVKGTSDGGSTWADGFSLPVCLATSDSSSITSIDQIFNGFGYIGSTVFVLPGVKGLIPNGRNDDGTLKNTVITVSNVLQRTQSASGWHGMWSLYITATAASPHPTELEYISDSEPTNVYTTTAYWYSPADNKLYYTQDTGASWTQSLRLHCVDYTESSTKITSLKHKKSFRAVDYNEFNTLFNQRVVQVSALPANPVTDTIYLIPE